MFERRLFAASAWARTALSMALVSALFLPHAHAQPVLITAPQTLNPGDTTITPTAGGSAVPLTTADITVRGTTLTINGRHNLSSLRLEINPTTRVRGFVTHSPNFSYDYSNGAGTDVVNGLSLILTGDVIVDTTCEIDVTGKGFPQQEGPGAGMWYRWNEYAICSGSGGSHGGRGGSNYTAEGGIANLPLPTYGSATEPTTFGSGGGSCESGGAGGGCIRIQTPARVIVEGFIRADGQTPPSRYDSGGAGAGGSIWIQAGLLAGRGQVVAAGGNIKNYSIWSNGCGGGGRVRLQACVSGLANWNAPAGGNNVVFWNGGAGPVFNSAATPSQSGTISSQATANIIVLRADRHFCPSESFTLTAATSLTNIVAVQWFKDGQPLTDSATVTGSGTNGLSFNNLQPGDNGLYEPRIQASCGTFMAPGTRITVGVPMITRLSASSTPIPFVDSAIAYDRDRQKLVLFGGVSGVDAFGYKIFSNQTWEFDGTTWTQRVIPSPPAVEGAAMAYDEARHVCVLAGGYGNASIWEWDGSNAGWQVRSSYSSNPATSVYYGAWGNPAAAYDPVRRVTVIFSGFAGYPYGSFDALFEWNGSTLGSVYIWPVFSQGDNSIGGPMGMSGAGLAFDRARGKMLLFGGMMDEGSSNDMWSWDGSTWSSITTEGPTRRWLHGMTYDEARQRVIVWSGMDRGFGIGDIWEWDGQAWSQVMGASTGLVGPAAAAVAYFPPNGTTYRFGGARSGQQSQITTYAPAAGFISGQPQSVSACAGNSASFTVNLANQSGLTYLWRKDGIPINAAANPSAATATLLITSPRAADVGSYDCVITNSCGVVISTPATLSICSGDLNCDGIVEDTDFVVFAASYDLLDCSDPAMPPGCPSDINGDGLVDDSDFVLFVNAYNALVCP